VSRKNRITNRVKELRERHGSMTQQQLGDAIGVTRQTVIAIERNRYSPSLESAFRIARLFDVGVEDVFNWEELSARRLATWLLGTLEGRWTDERTCKALISEFELSPDEARKALNSARDGVICAISGKKASSPDAKTDPIAHEAFDILWSSFEQNEFFATGRAPTRKWLDWYRDYKAQQSLDAQQQ
jgi:putative transcriptional regulator